MSDNERPIMIKKKNKPHEHEHHGGSWKIAYADFVTAMMAFFMLMWLINITNEEQKKGIADYFSSNFINMDSRNGSKGMMGGLNISGSNNSSGKNKDTSSKDTPNSTELGEKSKNKTNEQNTEQSDKDKQQTKFEQNNQLINKDKKLTEHENEKLPVISKEADLKKNKDQKLQNENTNINDREKDKDKDKDKESDKDKNTDKASKKESSEEKQLHDIEDQIKQALGKSLDLSDLKSQIVFEEVPEGLRIQLIDQDKKSMFPSGSYLMYPYTRQLLQIVANSIKDASNKIAIAGHTDSKPFTNTKNYSNWELSSDRALATRRVLEEYGIQPNRFDSITGKEATEPFIKENLNAPQNRRISITLFREQSGNVHDKR